MTASVPFSAPVTPPLTGQSICDNVARSKRVEDAPRHDRAGGGEIDEPAHSFALDHAIAAGGRRKHNLGRWQAGHHCGSPHPRSRGPSYAQALRLDVRRSAASRRYRTPGPDAPLPATAAPCESPSGRDPMKPMSMRFSHLRGLMHGLPHGLPHARFHALLARPIRSGRAPETTLPPLQRWTQAETTLSSIKFGGIVSNISMR